MLTFLKINLHYHTQLHNSEYNLRSDDVASSQKSARDPLWVFGWCEADKHKSGIVEVSIILLYLHRALNKVTQSANQHMHTFNFLFIKTYLKFLKTLLHVLVIRPSSGTL